MSTRADPTWQRFSRKDRVVHITLIVLTTVFALWAYSGVNVRWDYVRTSPNIMWDLATRMYPPDLAFASELVGPTIDTINMAIIGTVFAVIISIPVALIAADNISPNRYTLALGKLLITISRSVHTIVWAILIVIMFGPGVLAGVMAITVRSIGFCAKLISEEIEEISWTEVEAIEATGGNVFDQLIYGVIPQIKPPALGIIIFRMEINTRDATILGFVGAGGIGVPLQTSINTLQWPRVLTILIIIIGLVAIGEVASSYIRRKVGRGS